MTDVLLVAAWLAGCVVLGLVFGIVAICLAEGKWPWTPALAIWRRRRERRQRTVTPVVSLEWLASLQEQLEEQRAARLRWDADPDDHGAARFGYGITGRVCGVPLADGWGGERCPLPADMCADQWVERQRRNYEAQRRDRETRRRMEEYRREGERRRRAG